MANDSSPQAQVAEPEAAARKCRKHNLQLAPDGLCALCRRERNVVAEESSGGSFIGTVVFGALALIGVAVVAYWVTHPDKMPGEPVVREEHKGPPIEDQIAVVDDQLRELRALQRAGELNGAGLNQISQLEKKRKILVAVYEAQQDN
jgi:hypothetical protein